MININLVTYSYGGYEYFFNKNPVMDNINGYVIIKPGQKGYDCSYDFDDSTIVCHGGITYDNREYGPINNVDLNPKYRVIGFDTAHPGDYNKSAVQLHKNMEKDGLGIDPFKHLHHWTKPELAQECKMIIDQLNKGDYHKDTF